MKNITVQDLRRNGLCLAGAKRFFDQHELDWRDFVKNGIEPEKLADTGDAMALNLVEECTHGR